VARVVQLVHAIRCVSVYSYDNRHPKEHRKDAEIARSKVHTRAERKAAVTDHVASDSHVINWTGAEIMDREGNCRTRKVKESIWIRKEKELYEQSRRGLGFVTCLRPSFGHVNMFT